ncbi:MAG: glutathione S-transferase N-terminal domain-containing protein, partial [Verrucomicrobiota bacterium]
MTTFFRTPGCSQCDRISEALQDLEVSHRVVPVDPRSGRALGLPLNMPPPVLMNDGEVHHGHEAIYQYLESLGEFVST